MLSHPIALIPTAMSGAAFAFVLVLVCGVLRAHTGAAQSWPRSPLAGAAGGRSPCGVGAGLPAALVDLAHRTYPIQRRVTTHPTHNLSLWMRQPPRCVFSGLAQLGASCEQRKARL